MHKYHTTLSQLPIFDIYIYIYIYICVEMITTVLHKLYGKYVSYKLKDMDATLNNTSIIIYIYIRVQSIQASMYQRISRCGLAFQISFITKSFQQVWDKK